MNRVRSLPLASVLLAMLLGTAVSTAADLPELADLVVAESPAVVNISTARASDPRSGGLPPGFGMPGPFGDPGGSGTPGYDEAASLGSGFILSADGYVLTNAHVVQGADQVLVRTHDRRQYEAVVIGTDTRSDVALLKLDANGLPVVRVGDSGALRVGEWVVAIGSPFGFEHSVTTGIVSAKERSLPADHYVPFIQTDVALNPGNSGGPLFNMAGEVVGMNAQIYSRTGGFMGLSFAIPIDIAIEVAGQLRDHGEMTWGWLGVAIQEVTHDLAVALAMDRAEGALVSRVLADSPAESAGIEAGDIIISYDGKTVERSSSLPPMVGRTTVGTRVNLDILRSGERKSLQTIIERLPQRD